MLLPRFQVLLLLTELLDFFVVLLHLLLVDLGLLKHVLLESQTLLD